MVHTSLARLSDYLQRPRKQKDSVDILMCVRTVTQALFSA